ncbi:putative polysaccharide biosynthesis protein [Thalassobacillus pellis]|uniref:putative polysaccharide biosynthesis protein n=1 Tax=Thalassobacillus pellis TaxID=748008 RepID=UPI00195FBD38|nr:polysaccharide biosynthesis protein [Thalassobacillus pellis]MBM7551691.1 O-antigen/teichoic acid export membrane protein [Thalassobacillus pellis]
MSRSTFFKSTVILSIATLVSKFLGSVFRIPLQNIAGDEILGIFSLVYPVYMVALILSVAGIPIAISKLIAEARAKSRQTDIKQIYVTASILAVLFGLLSFSLIYSFSPFIAAALGSQSTRLALIVVGVTLLVAPYMAVYRGFFQGFDNMNPTAVSQVLEQLFRVGIILVLAYYLVSEGYSDRVVAGGIMAGSVIGALISLLYLRVKYIRSDLKITSGEKYSTEQFSYWSRTILKVSIPIAVGTITMALLNFVDSFTIPYGLKAAGKATNEINYYYGIYGRGLSLVQIATVFATSVVLPLIPLITTKLAERDYTKTRELIEKTHRITHILSWPAAFGLLALTLPINLALFTDLEGSLVLAIIGFSSVFTSLTVLGTGILQGMNLALQAALIIIGGVVLKTFVNISLIQLFGLTGAALSTLFVYFILYVINSYFIFTKMEHRVSKKETSVIIVSSILMGLCVGLPTLTFDIASWTRIEAFSYVAVAALIGGCLYFLQLYLWKIIDKRTIKNLPIVGKFLG